MRLARYLYPLVALLLTTSACQGPSISEPCVPCKDQARQTPTAFQNPAMPSVGALSWRNQWSVLHVIDGDTLYARQKSPDNYKRKEKIRLLNINTPEKGTPLFTEATEALKAGVKSGDITLVFQKENEEARGTYGRLLAYIFIDNTNVNLELVRQGYSPYVTKFGRSRYHEAFIAAEQDAKSAERGIWAQHLK